MLVEKTFDTGELTLSYAESDSPGSPMVLLHGLTGRRQHWDVLIPELETKWHIYALDLRGHGKSGRAVDNNYHVVDYARDVITFLMHIGEPTVLTGHSLGALTTIATAAGYPEGVRAAVLLDPPLFIRNSGIDTDPNVTRWFTWVVDTVKNATSPEMMFARCREMAPDADERTLQAMAAQVSGVAAGAPETALHNELLEGLDLGAAFRRIQCPTLLIRGDWDHGGEIREEDAEFVQAQLPSAVIVKIPDADHGLKMQEDPNIVLQHINDFLKPA